MFRVVRVFKDFNDPNDPNDPNDLKVLKVPNVLKVLNALKVFKVSIIPLFGDCPPQVFAVYLQQRNVRMGNIAVIILLPLLGTLLGASFVLFVSDRLASRFQTTLLGFASGVMVAASVWSLLIPAIAESVNAGVPAWLPAAAGFMTGIGFMLLLDEVTPHLHIDSDKPEGIRSTLGRSTMLVLAVTLHNIPEGMAVGVVAAGALSGEVGVTAAGAFALSLGIAIQNIPEGAIISLPLRSGGNSRRKSLMYGALSGVVEPVAAVITILLIEQLIVVFPYLLAFAAGAMIYVVIEELIPETHCGDHSNLSTVGFAVGFVIMMILDVALG